jgi:hypothetical protein
MSDKRIWMIMLLAALVLSGGCASVPEWYPPPAKIVPTVSCDSDV